ncbi:uncharacterized protein LOC126626205 [Malus sylvestris]|uniref:uncharacterized protein LOC126626205 n=1 Tax=Malus sylvestris TaxID=3752 RepID=UPI0021ACED01|nr:uncharacterized protein LOC126626205 [Malus sylvestris]
MSSTVMNPSSMHLNTVEPLTGVNYKKWKQDLEIVLGVMDWDLALRTEEPPTRTDGSTSSQKSKYEKWHKSNRISLLIIKRSMIDVVRGAFTDATNAKDFSSPLSRSTKSHQKLRRMLPMQTISLSPLKKSTRSHQKLKQVIS